MYNVLVLGDINTDYLKKNLNKLGDFALFFEYKNAPENIDFIVVRGSNFLLDKKYLSKFKSLKAIFQLGIGLDHIDLLWCKQKGIKIYNQNDVSVYSVSELAIGMLIMGIRNACFLHKKLLEKAYTREPKGFNLKGLKIGIMGYGRIGKQTTRLLVAWKDYVDISIKVFDIFPQAKDKFLYKHKISFFTNINKFKKDIDYLILHIPGKKENINLIDATFLKESNIKGIVNLSRKCIVNENDILNFLDKDKLEFYFSDVVCGEPDIKKINKKLLHHPKVLILPHIGANTIQVQKKLLDWVYSIIRDYLY